MIALRTRDLLRDTRRSVVVIDRLAITRFEDCGCQCVHASTQPIAVAAKTSGDDKTRLFDTDGNPTDLESLRRQYPDYTDVLDEVCELSMV